MPRRLFDSEYIFGLHDPGGEQLMLDAGRPGWIVFTEEIGRDPNNFSGKDFTPWSNRNLGILCRLNHGYAPNGTIPNSVFYPDFARRCANYVANSQGCKLWIIGNEMNFAIERPSLFARSLEPAQMPRSESGGGENQPSQSSPLNIITRPIGRLAKAILRGLSGGMGDASLFAVAGGDPMRGAAQAASGPPRNDDPFFHGSPQRFSALRPAPASSPAPGVAAAAAADTTEVITPELYARCYRLCRDAIHAIPGHADDQVLIGAVAPWNNQTTYPGNANGDWVQYLQDILRLLGANGCDGITLHTYTHGVDPNLITDEARMNPPFQNRRFHFRAYQDFMNAIPADMRHLPVYITETDEDDPWLDANNGWVQRAYGEIDFWNRQPGNQQIRSLVLYRWPNIDRWVIQTKQGVIADFRQALPNDYRWRSATPPPSGAFKAGDQVETTDIVNLRRSPGYTGKPASDTLAQIPAATRIQVLSSPAQSADNLTWWNVRYTRPGQPALDGWAAHTSPAGAQLLRALQTQPPPATGTFAVGDTVRTTTQVNLRRTPGMNNKPANDVVLGVPANTQMTVVGGPSAADGLTWWRVQGSVAGMNFEGWAAEKAPNGQALLVKVGSSDGVTPPPPAGKFQAGDAVVTRTVVRLRRSPGFANKPADDVIADIGQGIRGTVQSGPRTADNLTWWQVATTNPAGAAVTGWMAEAGPDGSIFLEKVSGVVTPPPVQGSFAIGELVATTDTVRVRRTPGTANKPADDVLGAFEPRTTLNVLEGPRSVDGLTWWRVGGITLTVGEVIGWVAEKAPGGATLVARPTKLPGTNIPDRATGSYLGVPFQGSFGISQLWGENPAIYGRITYDGVPLKGHNGVDFMTDNGTNVLATEDGVVMEVIFNDPNGFGNYIKLGHPWGESIYAHMETLGVQKGQSVRRGQVIGRSDNTGFSDGPHLHFAIRINPYRRTDGWGGFSDPLPYMNPTNVILPPYVLAPAPFRTLRPAGAPAPVAIEERRKTLEEAPGYAPDQPGLVRP